MDYPGPTPESAAGILSRALRGGGEMADVFIEDRRSLSMRLEDGKIESAVSGTDLGGSVRIMRGGSTVFGYVDSADQSSLEQLALVLSATPVDTGRMVAVQRDGRGERGGTVEQDPTLVEAAAKGRLLHLADDTARALSKDIRQVVVVYGESRQRVWVAGSHGLLSHDERTRVMFGITVMAERDGLIQIGHDTLAHHGGFELLDDAAVARLAADVGERALVLLGSAPAPAGRMPVVLGNGFGGVLFHEACGHGLEADYVLKKSSVWEGKIGQRVAGEHISAYDDGVSAGMWGSAGCDDEGTPCSRTTVIEEGILTGYLSDRLRSQALGLPLTGNGRRQDYRSLPYPRMTNTYFGPGRLSPDEIIADTARGLYAKSLSGGEVNPATGDFVFAVAEGYLIEKGRVTTPVRGATLIGNGLEVLLGIDAIADDLQIKAGMCGKEGQSVPVGSGQPTLRVREMTVGGTGL